MVNIARKDLIAKYGAWNTIHATDKDDNITINGNMKAWAKGSGNFIDLHNGNDNLWIGGKMWAWDGYNAILGDNGKKNITIKYGMEAVKGGLNEILLADKITHFTANHNLTIGFVNAHERGSNIISTGNGDDRIAFTGHLNVHTGGQNLVALGDGSKHISIAYGMGAWSGGKNILDMGVGNQLVTVGGNVHAGHGGKNQILSDGGNVSIHIKHNLDAIGINDIYVKEGNVKIAIDGNVFSHFKGTNRLVSEGKTTLIVGGTMTSYGLNQIETGAHDDVITISKGLYAYGGINQIITGEGSDRVNIKGYVVAGVHSTNFIETGDGNDIIHLNAMVTRKNLVIDAGDGYDTLILQATNVYSFKSQYQAWFSDMYQTSALIGSGLEEIQVDIGRGLNLNQIDWLTNMVNQHNATYGDDLAISLALDDGGARINLSDIFTPRDETSISIIDLAGKNANDLRISNTLASNGYDGNELRVDGDGNDRVIIDNTWYSAGGFIHENENYYHVWNNYQGESLLIQDGVDIYVY